MVNTFLSTHDNNTFFLVIKTRGVSSVYIIQTGDAPKWGDDPPGETVKADREGESGGSYFIDQKNTTPLEVWI